MRSLSATFRDQLESVASDDVSVIFVEISYSNTLAPIRANGDIVDYIYGGDTYLGCAFKISFLTDNDQPPEAKLWFPNVDRRIGAAIRNLPDAVSLTMRLMVKSDFDDNVPRQPIGTPVVEWEALHLFVRNVTCDAMGFTGTITSYDLATEPYPSLRSTPDELPGLYR